MTQSFRRSLVAILAGNAIYYGIERFLPRVAQHQLYQVDLGLAIAFCLCVACYGIARKVW